MPWSRAVFGVYTESLDAHQPKSNSCTSRPAPLTPPNQHCFLLYCDKVKHLGLTMKSTLRWCDAVVGIFKKAVSSVHSLKRIQHFLPELHSWTQIFHFVAVRKETVWVGWGKRSGRLVQQPRRAADVMQQQMDLWPYLKKWRISINTEKSTAICFRKRRRMPRRFPPLWTMSRLHRSLMQSISEKAMKITASIGPLINHSTLPMDVKVTMFFAVVQSNDSKVVLQDGSSFRTPIDSNHRSGVQSRGRLQATPNATSG
ncbi:hypothetical protein J6590_095257 [Homalodisca vitripennis]|nr:hypothetical protein J6590_095257 [Homalodisca vitripennis]